MPVRKEISKEFLDLCFGDTLLARLLINRGVEDLALVKYFTSLDQVRESLPEEIPEISKAFERILSAIKKQEKIMIFGDYDVDGTTSVALLYRAFKMIGFDLAWYVPSRHHEGYGLNKTALEDFKKQEISLVITCDCGISNYDEIEFANSIDLDVIVTDHHSIPDQPPPSVANCNPKTLPENHPLHYLPGVGVAYKLAEKLLFHFMDDAEALTYSRSLLDLVALGMVADLAPLRSENRYLTIQGLKVLARTDKVGLKKLLEVSGINLDPDAEHIGFGLAPRINAAGRLTEASKAVELMITEDLSEAEYLSAELDRDNKMRQELCSEVMEDAISMIMAKPEILENNVIALASDTWHHGIIGIVASRLLEKFHLPVFIMAADEGKVRGSVRAINIKDFDIYEEMKKIQEKSGVFSKFGGHKMAAGFSLVSDKPDTAIAEINAYFKTRLQEENLTKILKVDAAVKLEEMKRSFINRLAKLAPYGLGNPSAVFAARNLLVQRTRLMGKEQQHLKLYLKENVNEKRFYEAVLWGRAQDFIEEFGLKPTEKITIAFSPKINEFMGEETLQLDIKDWKKDGDVDDKIFDRFSR